MNPKRLFTDYIPAGIVALLALALAPSPLWAGQATPKLAPQKGLKAPPPSTLQVKPKGAGALPSAALPSKSSPGAPSPSPGTAPTPGRAGPPSPPTGAHRAGLPGSGPEKSGPVVPEHLKELGELGRRAKEFERFKDLREAEGALQGKPDLFGRSQGESPLENLPAGKPGDTQEGPMSGKRRFDPECLSGDKSDCFGRSRPGSRGSEEYPGSATSGLKDFGAPTAQDASRSRGGSNRGWRSHGEGKKYEYSDGSWGVVNWYHNDVTGEDNFTEERHFSDGSSAFVVYDPDTGETGAYVTSGGEDSEAAGFRDLTNTSQEKDEPGSTPPDEQPDPVEGSGGETCQEAGLVGCERPNKPRQRPLKPEDIAGQPGPEVREAQALANRRPSRSVGPEAWTDPLPDQEGSSGGSTSGGGHYDPKDPSACERNPDAC